MEPWPLTCPGHDRISSLPLVNPLVRTLGTKWPVIPRIPSERVQFHAGQGPTTRIFRPLPLVLSIVPTSYAHATPSPSHGNPERPSQSEVGKLQLPLPIDEQVLRLQVSMQPARPRGKSIRARYWRHVHTEWHTPHHHISIITWGAPSASFPPTQKLTRDDGGSRQRLGVAGRGSSSGCWAPAPPHRHRDTSSGPDRGIRTPESASALCGPRRTTCLCQRRHGDGKRATETGPRCGSVLLINHKSFLDPETPSISELLTHC